MKQKPVYTFSLWVFLGAFFMIGIGIFRFTNTNEKLAEPVNIAEIIIGFCLFVTASIYRSRASEVVEEEAEESVQQKPISVTKPEIVQNLETPATDTHNELAVLLKTLQEKGRFIDFIQDDVTKYSDTQVGAAARVVHQGCKNVLSEYLTITPVSNDKEQSNISLKKDFSAEDYKLTGNIKGEAPFNGKLIHKGWKVSEVKLPEVIANKTIPKGSSFVIAQAEVEL